MGRESSAFADHSSVPTEVLVPTIGTWILKPILGLSEVASESLITQAAEDKGSGDLKDAANWRCAAPK